MNKYTYLEKTKKKNNAHRTLIATTIKVGAETTFFFIFYKHIVSQNYTQMIKTNQSRYKHQMPNE